MGTTPLLQEIQAAGLAARMESVLHAELHLDLGESRFWVDSEIVLQYIANDSCRFHVFVANRVGEIRNLTKPDQWSHFAGVQNPADLISRGTSIRSLGQSDLFSGPSEVHQLWALLFGLNTTPLIFTRIV